MTPSPAELTLTAALATGIELFCNAAGQPLIRIPTDTDPGIWSLRSARVRHWVAEVCWETNRHLLPPRHVENVLNVLEAKAWSNPRRPSAAGDLLSRIEADALIQAVIAFMSCQTEWQGLMSNLLRRLTEVAKTHSLAASKATWPRIAVVLGARLRRVAATLEDLGIRVSISHTRHGAMVRLEKLTLKADPDSQATTASPGASRLNGNSDSDLTPGDARDAQNFLVDPTPSTAATPSPKLKSPPPASAHSITAMVKNRLAISGRLASALEFPSALAGRFEAAATPGSPRAGPRSESPDG